VEHDKGSEEGVNKRTREHRMHESREPGTKDGNWERRLEIGNEGWEPGTNNENQKEKVEGQGTENRESETKDGNQERKMGTGNENLEMGNHEEENGGWRTENRGRGIGNKGTKDLL
jgi:hypothetical protein